MSCRISICNYPNQSAQSEVLSKGWIYQLEDTAGVTVFLRICSIYLGKVQVPDRENGRIAFYGTTTSYLRSGIGTGGREQDCPDPMGNGERAPPDLGPNDA